MVSRTPRMAETQVIKCGDLLRDNDPRMPNRKLIVIKQDGRIVICRELGTGKRIKLSVDRVFTDGKPRRYGMNLVEE